MRSVRAAAVLCGALGLALAGPAASQTAQPFSVYPSYSAKFDIGTEKFSLVTSVVVYNISGQTFTDVTFKQTYPDGVTVKETYQREVGTEATGESSAARKVEGNVFYATMPTFKNRQYAVIFNELDIGRRLNQITFPGVEVAYADPSGARQTTTLQPSTEDLFIYSNVVGGLERFLKKYNNITFEFQKAVPARKEWEFAPIAASAQGRIPTGVIGTFPGRNRYNGHFRVRSGPPGDNLQIVVVYRETDKKEIVADRETLLKRLREYVRWCGEFEIAQEGLQVNQATWKKYDGAWNVEGRWVDTITSRLGEGIVQARVFFGPREDVEYFVVGLVHGRALGADSTTPNPEKEAQLAGELSLLLDTFKSHIIPLSHERR
jgi:hypothetical protein